MILTSVWKSWIIPSSYMLIITSQNYLKIWVWQNALSQHRWFIFMSGYISFIWWLVSWCRMRLFYYTVYLSCNISNPLKSPFQPSQSIRCSESHLFSKFICSKYFSFAKGLWEPSYFVARFMIHWSRGICIRRWKFKFHYAIGFSHDRTFWTKPIRRMLRIKSPLDSSPTWFYWNDIFFSMLFMCSSILKEHIKIYLIRDLSERFSRIS